MNKYRAYKNKNIFISFLGFFPIVSIFIFIFLPFWGIKKINKEIINSIKWFKKNEKRIAAI